MTDSWVTVYIVLEEAAAKWQDYSNGIQKELQKQHDIMW